MREEYLLIFLGILAFVFAWPLAKVAEKQMARDVDLIVRRYEWGARYGGVVAFIVSGATSKEKAIAKAEYTRRNAHWAKWLALILVSLWGAIALVQGISGL
jgi:hypothetical protein